MMMCIVVSCNDVCVVQKSSELRMCTYDVVRCTVCCHKKYRLDDAFVSSLGRYYT